MARTGPSGWRGVSVPFSAVGDQVERLEHDLSDQDLAPGRSHDGLGPRGEVSYLDRDVRHGALFPPLVRVDDGSRSEVSEPQHRVEISVDEFQLGVRLERAGFYAARSYSTRLRR